jgi:DMSO reductase anchor subunit
MISDLAYPHNAIGDISDIESCYIRTGDSSAGWAGAVVARVILAVSRRVTRFVFFNHQMHCGGQR